MAHNINTYIGRQAAWHALGTVTNKYQTTAELLADEGFQYDVFKSQLNDGRGNLVDAWGTFRWDHADKLVKDSSKARFLGVVGEDYKVIQHREGFAMMDALMSTADGAHYETAGVLGNGETVWALADLKLAINVGDDQTDAYVLFATSHDGSMSHSHRLTTTRVVCQNTLNIAMSAKVKSKLTVRHTKNADVKIAAMHEALASIGSDVKSVGDKLNYLAGRKLMRENMDAILTRLFPKTENNEGVQRDTTRRTNIVADILKIYELNDGNAFPEQRGSAYNLLNAITNYTDHERSAKGDQRALSAMFGSGDKLKADAFQLIMAESQKMPELVYMNAGAKIIAGRAPMVQVPQVAMVQVAQSMPVQSSGTLLDSMLSAMGD